MSQLLQTCWRVSNSYLEPSKSGHTVVMLINALLPILPNPAKRSVLQASWHLAVAGSLTSATTMTLHMILIKMCHVVDVWLLLVIHKCIFITDTVKWRTEAKIEECLETFLPDDKDNKLRRFLPSGFLGVDKAVIASLTIMHVYTI